MDIRQAETSFLALLIWREARGQPFEGMVAVAWTARNRVESPKWWGTDYLSVIGKKWQYSAMAAPGDPQLILYPKSDDKEFIVALHIAEAVIAGNIPHPAPGADSYFATTIQPPDWATDDKFVKQIGAHRFFNIDEDYES